MLNRLNNLKFVWAAVMMVFLMTCLPGCKKEISETIETRDKVLKSTRPLLFRYALLRESGWVEAVIKIFLTTKNTKNSQSPLIIKLNNQTFVSFVKILCDLCGKEFRLLKQALPAILNSRSRKDEFKSRRHCGIFFVGRTKTARLFRPNSPTIQTKQPDYLDQTARLFRSNSPPV